MDFSGFTSVDLCIRDESTTSYIYVILSKDESGAVIPLYVGQTKRIWGRIDDYFWASFGAATDFKVGESIRHLADKKHSVSISYRPAKKPLQEERQIIELLHKEGYKLLNDHKGYTYTLAIEEREREEVRQYVDEILSSCKILRP